MWNSSVVFGAAPQRVSTLQMRQRYVLRCDLQLLSHGCMEIHAARTSAFRKKWAMSSPLTILRCCDSWYRNRTVAHAMTIHGRGVLPHLSRFDFSEIGAIFCFSFPESWNHVSALGESGVQRCYSLHAISKCCSTCCSLHSSPPVEDVLWKLVVETPSCLEVHFHRIILDCTALVFCDIRQWLRRPMSHASLTENGYPHRSHRYGLFYK